MTEYVVGVDASERASEAVAWALDDATPDDSVVAVHVWQTPVILGPEVATVDPSVFEDEGRQVLDDVIGRAVAERPDAAGRIRGELLHGHPGRHLVERAGSDDVLVVGARGHGGVAGMLLGSTSTYVAHHAHCPTVVVPHDR